MYGDDDAARIAAANLLDNYREQWNENYARNTEVSSNLDEYLFKLRTGRVQKTHEIMKLLNESLMLTPANRKANMELAHTIKEYIRHISRRKPKARLTILYLRRCQQAYVDSISANFVHQSQLVSMVLISVFSNINIITRSTLIPKSVKEEMEEYRGFEEDEFGEDKDK